MATLRTRLERMERRRGMTGGAETLVVYICSARCEGAAEGEAYCEGGAIISVPEAAIVTGPGKTFQLARAEGEHAEAFMLRAETAVAEASQG